MRPNKQTLDPSVFMLASNLFGISQTAKEPQLTAKVLHPENCIVAIYPAITGEAYTQTMDNYRNHIAIYNLLTAEENDQIEKHNMKVRQFRKTETLSEVQREFSALFLSKNKGKGSREFNDLADNFNFEYDGLLIEKKKIQTVKAVSEMVFQNFIHVYNCQLMKRNKEFMRLNVKTARPLQKLEVNSAYITSLERNNVQSLNLCSKTIRLHRERLTEAGVFLDYQFCGSNAAVKVAVNTEILAVMDLQTSKVVTLENQRLTPVLSTKRPDNDETTRPHQKECEIRENASDFLDKELPLVVPSVYKNQFYKNTGSNQEKITIHPPGDGVKIPETLSEKLRELIIHPQELAIRLAAHEFDNYNPIDIRLLHSEAYKGTLNRSEFRDLIIQDFFKSSAKLYRDANVFPGAWKNAINIWLDVKFISFTGHEFNKDNVVDDVAQLRWRLEHARKWFVKHEFNRLFPSDYFDPLRKNAKEVGFEYTKKAWERRAEYESKSALRKRQRESDAAKRVVKINHSKKCETQIRRFLKDKITMPQLMDYVSNNLPPDFIEKLPGMIERLMQKK